MRDDLFKVAVVGAGNVGCTFAFSLMMKGIVREIALIDVNREKAEGECMDLNHGASFVPPVNIYAAGFEGCDGADVVVLTAGAKQRAGETRIDLVRRNVELFRELIPRIVEYTDEAILLVVSNPVDILTYATLKLSGLPSNQVLGSGTVLDSSRFRYLLSDHYMVDARNVHAYIIGEHGDSELPVWSRANIGGILLRDYCRKRKTGHDYEKELDDIFMKVRHAAYEIIEFKGATYYAIALALVRIVEAVLRDENSVLPVSTLINDYCGVDDVCLSIPSLVNREGVKEFLRVDLSDDEGEQFRDSARKLREVIDELDL